MGKRYRIIIETDNDLSLEERGLLCEGVAEVVDTWADKYGQEVIISTEKGERNEPMWVLHK